MKVYVQSQLSTSSSTIFIHSHTHTHTQRERERKGERGRETVHGMCVRVGSGHESIECNTHLSLALPRADISGLGSYITSTHLEIMAYIIVHVHAIRIHKDMTNCNAIIILFTNHYVTILHNLKSR